MYLGWSLVLTQDISCTITYLNSTKSILDRVMAPKLFFIVLVVVRHETAARYIFLR
jgi:hypothetical protein